MGEKLTDTFMELFCEKNWDGTKNLRLKGKDMFQRIGKRLKAKDMVKVGTFVRNHPEIIKLDLCYNNIGDEGIRNLVDHCLVHDNNLQHLNLMACDITWHGAEWLHSAADNLQLQTLRINCNKLGFKGGQFVADLLGSSNTLKLLDVSDTDQTLATVQYLLAMIREDVGSNATLNVLDFSRLIPFTDLYQYDPAHFAEAIGLMLKVNTTLVELHIQKNEFDGHDVELLLIGLEKNSNLLVLDLGYNRIGDHGIELLASWLKKRPNLLGLNIAGNQIGNLGARALSFGMPFSKLRMLDITDNKIRDEGIVDILNTIKKPYMMRLFYIWGNKLGPNSLKIMRRMFLSGVLNQELVDVKLYSVDKVLHAAYYPANHFKHRHYCVMDYGCPIPLRIIRNRAEVEGAQPRALVNFIYYDRFPEVDESLSPKNSPCDS